jgi:hypothetical protein
LAICFVLRSDFGHPEACKPIGTPLRKVVEAANLLAPLSKKNNWSSPVTLDLLAPLCESATPRQNFL